MRKRLVLFWTLLLLGSALVLPASAAAGGGGSYSYVVQQNYCSNGGVPNIKVKLIKPAGLYPDRFTIDATGQHSQSFGGNYSNESAPSHFQRAIPDQYAKFTWSKSIYWDPPDGRWHRIKLRMKVWNNGNVIASKTIYSVKC